MRNHFPSFKLVAIFLLTLVLLTALARLLPFAVNAARSTERTTVAQHEPRHAGQKVAAQPNLPPVLLSTTPAADTPWDGGPVTLTFDQPLAAESNASLTIEPALTGEVTVDGANLIFTPGAAPTPGERYHFTVDADALSAAGVALGNPVAVTLVAAAPLAVTATQPSDGAEAIDTDSQIVVVFNRPVVELTGLNDQASLPQPLTIEPAVEGTGEWLNTSIYVFKPRVGLAGGTDYTVTIADVISAQGEALAEPVVARFSTATPIVTGV